VAILAGVLAGSAPAMAQQSSTIGFSPGVTEANPGDSFSVDVVVDLAEEIRGAQFGLKFDPSVIQISSVSEGTYLKDWAKGNQAQSAAAVPFQVDNNRGEVSIGGIILLGGTTNGGPSGQGVLATVKGTVTGDGSAGSALTLTAVKFASTRPDAGGVPNVVVNQGGVSVGGSAVPAPDPSGGVLRTGPQNGPPPSNDDSTPPADNSPSDDSSTGGSVPGTVANSEAAVAASEFGPVYHDTLKLAQTEPSPIVVPTSAPVFASDSRATAVAAAATATVLTGVVPVTPPAVPQPQPPAGAQNPTARPSPITGVATPAAPVTQNTIVPRAPVPSGLRPTGSSGIFIPWEVVAGIGGGIVAAGLVLFAFRRTPPQSNTP
jgi:hypothetical protein